MTLFTSIIFMAGGIMLLVKSADYLIDGAVSLARRFEVKPIVIGLTVVAFGTSAPEFTVSFFSIIADKTDVAVGNILGSNITNILLILGATTLIRPLAIKTRTIWREIPLALLAPILLLIMTNDRFLASRAANALGRIDGIILLVFFFMFLYYTYMASVGERNQDGITVRTFWRSMLLIFMGLVGLTAGGKIVVDSAVAFSQWFGLSERVIGLTVIALGTSLPELATTLTAVHRKQVDIAVGNVIGSNIFNIFLILGIGAIIRPIPFGAAKNFDTIMVIAATLFLFVALFVGQKNVLKRWQGALSLGLYTGYIVFTLLN